MTEKPQRVTEPPIDVSSVLERIGGDASFLKELLDLYRSDFKERFANLSQAVESRDFQAIREIGHTLKGSSANLSLLELQNISRNMEFAGRDTDIVAAKRCLEDMKAAFLRLNISMDERYPEG